MNETCDLNSIFTAINFGEELHEDHVNKTK